MEYHFNVEFIEAEIAKRNMGKKEFAHICGISYYILKKILSDNMLVSPWPVKKLAKFLNVSIESLIC